MAVESFERIAEAATHSRREARAFWLAAAAVFLAGLPAVSRWFRAELPAGADTAIHLYRAVQLDWAIRHGYWYPRWAPDLVFGFGYPLFQVHGPLAQYLIAGLHALGLSFIAATLGAFVMADLLGALGAFVLAREHFGLRAGLLSALAYAYAPYVLGSLYRGSPAEALALGLLPWLLWAFGRLYRAPTSGRFALAAGLVALFPLLHNPSTVLALGTLAAFVVARVWIQLSAPKMTAVGRRSGLWAALALLLGLALSAFFWLPALAEMRYIQIERAYSTGVLDFHNNFLAQGELFSFPQAFDARAIGRPAPRSLGWPQLALALVGLVRWRRHPSAGRWLIAFSAAGAVLLSFLTLPAAVWFWDHLPFLSSIQFPARLLGPASLLLALLAGTAIPTPEPEGSRTPEADTPPAVRDWRSAPADYALPAAVLITALSNLTWTYQHSDPLVSPNPTITELHAFERRTGAIGTTTAGEYLPIWVQELPQPDRLEERYAAGPIIHRLDSSSLPSEAHLISQSAGLVSQTVELESAEAFEAVFQVFYFPGWRARIDGGPAEVRPSSPHGLVIVPVPAGRHTITLEFGSTPIRIAAGLLSFAALIVWAIPAAIGLRTRMAGRPRQAVSPVQSPSASSPATRPLALVAMAGLALYGIKVASLDRKETIFAHTRFDGVRVADVQQPLAVNFGDRLELLGVDLKPARVPSGETLMATLYWRALQPLDLDYSVSLALEDEQGHRFAQADTQHPGGFPTSRWPLDRYAYDRHALALLPGTPPGKYHLVVSAYHYPDLAVLPPFGYPWINSGAAIVGEVEVGRPNRRATLAPQHPLSAGFGPVELIGVDLGLNDLGVGGDLPIAVYWRVNAIPDSDYSLRVALLNADGMTGYEAQLPPVRADYPTHEWKPGDALMGRLSLRIPAELDGGLYSVALQVVGPAGPLGKPVEVGKLRVLEPYRTFEAPAVSHPTSAHFGAVAELLGWDLAGNHLRLYWRALRTTELGYAVFVHVLDPAGQIMAQRDTPPMNGARPTTSWLPGEVLVDEYDLDLPPDEFTIAVGLYDPNTGERLRLGNGEDRLLLFPSRSGLPW